MHDPVTHSTAPVQAAVDTMKHYLFFVGERDDRNKVVIRIGARQGKTIMFMRTKHGVDRQAKKLRRAGISAMGLHGDKGQNTRSTTLQGFADGSVSVLVATDIAARGIDVQDVSLVVHVDPPSEHKAYLHRAGRTARAGESGTVVTLVMNDQRDEVAKLVSKAGVDAETIDISTDANPAHNRTLAQITGAQSPTGIPLAEPGQQQKKKQPSKSKPSKPQSGKGRTPSRNGQKRGRGASTSNKPSRSANFRRRSR